jgi:5-methylcytosine-specific restriction endonuclease McrA
MSTPDLVTIVTTLPVLNRKQRQRRNRKRNKRREPIRIALWLDDPHCRYCRIQLRTWKDGILDHMTPASRGGGDGMTNAALWCKCCDRAKGNRTVKEWREDLLAGLFSIGKDESQ